MPTVKVHLYANGATPLQTEELHVADVHQARGLASTRKTTPRPFSSINACREDGFLGGAGVQVAGRGDS